MVARVVVPARSLALSHLKGDRIATEAIRSAAAFLAHFGVGDRMSLPVPLGVFDVSVVEHLAHDVIWPAIVEKAILIGA